MFHQTVVLLLSLVFVVALQAYIISGPTKLDEVARKAFIKDYLSSKPDPDPSATVDPKIIQNIQIAAKKYVNGVQLYSGECLIQQKNASNAFHAYHVVDGVLEYTERDPCTNTVNFAQTFSNFPVRSIIMFAGVVFPLTRETESQRHGGDLCALSDTILYSIEMTSIDSLNADIGSGI